MSRRFPPPSLMQTTLAFAAHASDGERSAVRCACDYCSTAATPLVDGKFVIQLPVPVILSHQQHHLAYIMTEHLPATAFGETQKGRLFSTNFSRQTTTADVIANIGVNVKRPMSPFFVKVSIDGRVYNAPLRMIKQYVQSNTVRQKLEPPVLKLTSMSTSKVVKEALSCSIRATQDRNQSCALISSHKILDAPRKNDWSPLCEPNMWTTEKLSTFLMDSGDNKDNDPPLLSVEDIEITCHRVRYQCRFRHSNGTSVPLWIPAMVLTQNPLYLAMVAGYECDRLHAKKIRRTSPKPVLSIR